jgi:hypothetical protein
MMNYLRTKIKYPCLLTVVFLSWMLSRTAFAKNSVGNKTVKTVTLKSTLAIEITGRVTNVEDGLALPGVSVAVKGTTNGTVTDADGQYKITVPNAESSLVFSFVGFLTQEIALSNRTTIDIALGADLRSLSEVVVVGYGTQRKSDVTGSVSSISAKDIKQVPVASLDQAL